MDDPRAIRRFVRPAGSFDCEASDGTVFVLNVTIEFERTYSLAARHDKPIGYHLFWRGRRVEWVAKGRYRSADGVDLTTSDPDAP